MSTRRDVDEQNAKVLVLRAELDAVMASTNDSDDDISSLARDFPTYRSAIRAIADLRQDVALQRDSQRASDDDVATIQNLEDGIRRLETQLADRCDRVAEVEANLRFTRDGLSRVTGDLSQIYCLLCDASGESPVKAMMDQLPHRRGRRRIDDDSKDAATSDTKNDSRTSEEKEEVSNDGRSRDDSNHSTTCYKLIEMISEQLKHVGRASDRLAATTRQNPSTTTGDPAPTEELAELQEQVVKLRAMLATKREQISTLRGVLKANKATAETAMANLKEHYDREKSVVTDNVVRLRGELAALKEDAAAFAALRAAFAQRCDEYTTQLDELQRQLVAAEEEKKTLNSLLRMALQQKLALTSKMEDLESDRERKNARPQRPSTRARGSRLGYYGSVGPHQGHDESSTFYNRYSPQPRYQRRDY